MQTLPTIATQSIVPDIACLNCIHDGVDRVPTDSLPSQSCTGIVGYAGVQNMMCTCAGCKQLFNNFPECNEKTPYASGSLTTVLLFCVNKSLRSITIRTWNLGIVAFSVERASKKILLQTKGVITITRTMWLNWMITIGRMHSLSTRAFPSTSNPSFLCASSILQLLELW